MDAYEEFQVFDLRNPNVTIDRSYSNRAAEINSRMAREQGRVGLRTIVLTLAISAVIAVCAGTLASVMEENWKQVRAENSPT